MNKIDCNYKKQSPNTEKRKSRKRMLFNIIMYFVVFYILYAGFCFLMQRNILFPRYQIQIPSEPLKYIADIEQIWLETEQGKVEVWFLPPKEYNSSKPVPAFIIAHGNATLIDYWIEQVEGLRRLGVAVLLVEYPGYGRSEGKPSQKSITDTFVIAYDMLIAREDIDASKIILLGRSVGGGAVSALATKRPSAALILFSTFTSVRSLASKRYLPSFMALDPFDNLRVVSEYPNPILIIHGKKDDTIPYDNGIALYQAAKNGEMITYDCSHNDCPPSWKVFWQDIYLFLHKVDILE